MRGFIIIIIQWYITMKKAFSLLALSAVASSAFAQDDNWYVGLNVLNTNAEHKSTVSGIVSDSYGVTVPARVNFSDMSKETGFGLNLGKQILLNNQFAVGVEAEYLSFGSFSTTLKMSNPSTGMVYDIVDDKSEMKVTAFNLNIKPKYYFSDTDFYLGGTAGVGKYKADFKSLGDGSNWGFNYGIEVGYDITSELSVSAGYRLFMTDIGYKGGDIELELDSFYAGLAYKF
ncbi:hypothetical protein VIBC2010_08273 [Vibrio caribbeanicus ATCC BAA-2122]|uniref:Outer membrane protein beta-barrel domain-containing protein n=2 Tax=Vibrio caribbeanicus TaxID=701175 RepID=E3BEB1_9VIBR|nr:hypothetical protein VIBC2010_08273 [Vibrio caribbeanicus ATCC BAA-2122]